MGLMKEDLKDIKLFDGVYTESIYGLLQYCPIKQLKAKEVLMQPGGGNECMYIVLAGELGVHLETLKNKAILDLSRGDSVGEFSLIDNQPRSAYVVANGPARLLEINRDVFWSMVNASREVAVNLLVMLSARLRGNNDAVAESIKEQNKFRSRAMVDGLTGLHNRRWLDEVLPRQINRARISGEMLSVGMIDIDHFKNFNDNYGHQEGDAVLIALAECLRTGLRPTDFSARYGGEEFTIVLPQTSGEDALIAANRIREIVSSLELVSSEDVKLPQVTVSIGIAELNTAHQSMTSLVKAADRALYSAKNSGRNRACKAD